MQGEESKALRLPRSRRGVRSLVGMGIRVALLIGVGGVLALLIRSSDRDYKRESPRGSERDCETAILESISSIALEVCRREYERTLAPRTGARLADLHRRLGQPREATTYAFGLLATSARADAFQILGKIEIQASRLEQAQSLLEYARAGHRATGQWSGVADDNQALARVFELRGRLSDALRALQECLEIAARSYDGIAFRYCRMPSWRILSRLGLHEMTNWDIEDNEGDPPIQRAEIASEKANAAQEEGHNRLAVELLLAARKHGADAQFPPITISAELNLAYSYAELGFLEAAETSLASARALDLDSEYLSQQDQLAARIAYHRGQYSKARELGERGFASSEDIEEKIDIAVMQTRVAWAIDDREQMLLWARRGVEEAERLQSMQSSVTFRSPLRNQHREPYDVLFSTYVKLGRVDEALLAFNAWQGRAVVDLMSHPGTLVSADLHQVARRLEELTEHLPSVKQTTLAQPADPDLMTKVVRTIDLLALIVADNAVWRIASSGGELSFESLGEYDALQSKLTRFIQDPLDPAMADRLGALLVGPELFPVPGRTLHVLLDGKLANLPVAALRRGGRPLIAERPIVRILRLPEATCLPPVQPKGAVVVADAVDDLPEARKEAKRVARRLGVGAFLHSQATRDRVLSVKRDQVLHAAVHAEPTTDGASLELADGSLSALEITAQRVAPVLAVLSSCASAFSNDPSLTNSLPTAFLAAGSRHVIATLKEVDDRDAAEITSALYDEGALTDPVRALTRVQAKLAGTTNREWPRFAIYGLDVCQPEP